MNQDNAPITKENLRAVLCEEWLNILREELGEDAPATIGDIRQIAGSHLRKSLRSRV